MSDLKKRKSLTCAFDAEDGRFNTPEKFIRAYLREDRRALSALGSQNADMIRDTLEKMRADIRIRFKKKLMSQAQLREFLNCAKKEAPAPVS